MNKIFFVFFWSERDKKRKEISIVYIYILVKLTSSSSLIFFKDESGDKDIYIYLNSI